MKKILLAFTFIAYVAGAQTPYNKMLGANTTEWDIFQALLGLINGPGHAQNSTASTASIPMPAAGRCTAKTDTTVLGKNYKKYFTAGPSSTVNTHMGYLREDTVARKVYYLDKFSLTEYLLYNFALNVGDTVYLNFPNSSGTYPQGFYKATLINNVMTRVGLRKQFNLKHISASSDTLKYIEGIGSIIHPTYMGSSFYYSGGLFPSSGPGCTYPYYIGLACKFSDGQKYYQSCTYSLTTYCFNRIDSCNYYSNCGGIRENSIFQNTSLYPNPGANKLHLTTSVYSNAMVTIEVTDVTGRFIRSIYKDQLAAGENNLELDLEGIEQGSYFLNLKTKDENVRIPLLIMH